MKPWLAMFLMLAAAGPATIPVDQSTPRGALKVFSRALDAGDRKAILDSLAADSDQDRKVADATAELAEASAALRTAATKAFGERARPLGVDPAASADAMTRIDTSTETIEGETATVRPADNEGPPMTLVRRDGRWLLPISELSKDVEAADIDKNLDDIAAQVKVMRGITMDVAAGKFSTAVDARQALDQRIVGTALPATKPVAQP